jgi:hypothetical protein
MVKSTTLLASLSGAIGAGVAVRLGSGEDAMPGYSEDKKAISKLLLTMSNQDPGIGIERTAAAVGYEEKVTNWLLRSSMRNVEEERDRESVEMSTRYNTSPGNP